MISILIIAPNLTSAGMEGQLVMLLRNINPLEFQVELALFRDIDCPLRNELPSHIKIIDLKKRGKFDVSFYRRMYLLVKSSTCDLITGKISGVNELLMPICGWLHRDGLLLEIQSTRIVLAPYYRLMKLFLLIFPNRRWWVLCNCRKAVNELTRYLPPRTPIDYIGNGVDLDRFRRTSTPPSTLLTIGFIGRVMPLKNLETLFHAVHWLNTQHGISQVKVIITGRHADPAYLNKLIRIQNRLQLNTQIQFNDHVDNVESLYNQMDVFVLPSLVEGTPNVLLEAMACERVCLVSKDANTDQFVGEEFQFATQDFRDLSLKLMAVKNLNLTQREDLGRRNRVRVSENYAIPLWAARYQAIWKKAVRTAPLR